MQQWMRTRVLRTVGLLFGLSMMLTACDGDLASLLDLIGGGPAEPPAEETESEPADPVTEESDPVSDESDPVSDESDPVSDESEPEEDETEDEHPGWKNCNRHDHGPEGGDDA